MKFEIPCKETIIMKHTGILSWILLLLDSESGDEDDVDDKVRIREHLDFGTPDIPLLIDGPITVNETEYDLFSEIGTQTQDYPTGDGDATSKPMIYYDEHRLSEGNEDYIENPPTQEGAWSTDQNYQTTDTLISGGYWLNVIGGDYTIKFSVAKISDAWWVITKEFRGHNT